ncbi:MAG: hypothetical protein AUJ52_15420 [Elusimicrobia bacterium CG1_02_63_36]|nr:MAG: hypothetical protein AUJ52_15420 [Elusimicrobia bacterium CG1_02_63_36]PIP84441.1 MAG: hypothetical protein COR54_04560 [Elusimicrobia bacterium CG22_combo_CG10-13_8_21_14_all_63_91]PJA18297.1 MAG: hypothetical protein COX66_01700 [Elusimicrobia bacterium CG_4_10_14_0_2_um_filter_63_34]PJB23438.1 MAG: hypothetical protein CO113_18540 [Elusimicrobia bacterium CG_4_9_14_3_um_filter_62_55]
MRTLSLLLVSLLACGLSAPRLSAQEISESEKTPAGKPDPLKAEKEALEKITIENRIRKAKDEAEDHGKGRVLDGLRYGPALEKAKFDDKMKSLMAEKEELSLKYALELEKLKLELAAMELEQKRLEAKDKLDAAKFQVELADVRRERDKLLLESQLKAEKDKKAMEALKDQKEKAALELEVKLIQLRDEKATLQAENDKKTEEMRRVSLESQTEREQIDMELKRIMLEGTKLKLKTDERQNELALLRSEIDIREKKHDWKDETNREPIVLKEPFQKGVLTISDRRIDLNGPIYDAVGVYITDRIDYYNNVSNDPIFLVIGTSPGGSVWAGARILKSIQESKAPVHVVLKTAAASMAAVIISLAPHSYAYPNAFLLHHQMYRFTVANTRELREELEWRKKWEDRLFEPLAKKFGFPSMEKFRDAMYTHDANGNWKEFADDAKKMKWVDNIAYAIRETGIIRDPDAKEKATAAKARFLLEEKVDDQGKRFVQLPRIDPMDFYYLHNPDNYYR